MAEAVRCAHARTVCFMAERTVLPHISKKREYMVVSSAGRDNKFPWRAERRVAGTAPTVGSPDSGSRFQRTTRVSLRAREG